MSDEIMVEEVEAADVPAEEAPSDVPAEAPPTLEDQLAAAQAEAADYKDRWLRSQAEFANARKRMEKQRVETYAHAAADVLVKLLPAIDDFDRAMANIPEDVNGNSWLEGIELVRRKLAGILESLNVTPIEAVGTIFDPQRHEAIAQEASDEFDSGVVCRELQKGYAIGDRVIRPALVNVAE